MSEPVLRIFSYLPNPRVWKALIAADLCGVSVEVVGDKPANLSKWLWDYDARELAESERTQSSPHARVGQRGFQGTLFKTDAFLTTQPFGTVPCAFSPGGDQGIFESNSILRAVARAGGAPSGLYGTDGYSASRIDSFLDAGLVFAREAQVYLLAMDNMSDAIYERMAAAYAFYMQGIERALTEHKFLIGDTLSLADIAFVCDLSQFLREGHYVDGLAASGYSLISQEAQAQFPRTLTHMLELNEHPTFARHMGSYLNWYLKLHGLEKNG